MAGAPWNFTVIPSTITQVTITDGYLTEIATIKGLGRFSARSFVETNTVTISAYGYQDVTAVVGDSTITFTALPLPQGTPLYAWTNGKNLSYPYGPTTIYTTTPNPTSSDSIYNANGEIITSTTYYGAKYVGNFRDLENMEISSKSGTTLTINHANLGATDSGGSNN